MICSHRFETALYHILFHNSLLFNINTESQARAKTRLKYIARSRCKDVTHNLSYITVLHYVTLVGLPVWRRGRIPPP
jgi:hypothetical protein